MLPKFSSRSPEGGKSAPTPCPWGLSRDGAVLREVLAAGGSAGREEPGAGSRAGQHPGSTGGAALSGSTLRGHGTAGATKASLPALPSQVEGAGRPGAGAG